MAGFLLNGCGASDSYYKIKDLHQARCKCCRRETSWALMELKMKIRIVYIPTVPIRTKYAVICTACKTGFYVDDAQRRFILDHPSSCVEIKEDGVLIHGIGAGSEPDLPRLPVQIQPASLIEEQYDQEQQALQQSQLGIVSGPESSLSGQVQPGSGQMLQEQTQVQPSLRQNWQPSLGQVWSLQQGIPFGSRPEPPDTKLSQHSWSQIQPDPGRLPLSQPQTLTDSEGMPQLGQNQRSSGLELDTKEMYIQPSSREQIAIQSGQCSFCGVAMEKSDPFCRNCGRRPAAPSPLQTQEGDFGEQIIVCLRLRKICPSCRLTFTGDKEFCGVCGKKLIKKE
ncbi:zinc ribbon domain-containing protein [Lachnospiraceae bacterium 62-35]